MKQRSWLSGYFKNSPMETYLMAKGILGGIWYISHPTAFESARSWVVMVALGTVLPGGPAIFFGVIRFIIGLLHFWAMGVRVKALRLLSCSFSAIFYAALAYILGLGNSSSPTIIEYFVLSLGGAYMFMLILLQYEPREGDPLKKLRESDPFKPSKED